MRLGRRPRLYLGSSAYQPEHSKSLWSVERMTHRGLPDNFNPVRRRPLTTKQIDSKPVSNCRSVALQSREWNAHGSVPDFRGWIDASGYREAGVPRPAIFVMRLGKVNVEIDPLPLRRDFELFVSADVLKIRTNEDLGNIPIPKLICLG